MATKKKELSPEEQQQIESEIRELAYLKWESSGCPCTGEEERKQFWLEAENEILKIKGISRTKK